MASSTLARPADALLDEIRRRAGEAGFVLVDALPRASWEEGHLPGARSLPLDEVESRAHEVLPRRDEDVVVYCGGPT